MASLNYFPDGEAIREFFEPAVKIPLNPPLSKGDDDGFSPLASGPEGLSPSWRALRAGSRPGGQRGVRGDLSKIMAQLGYKIWKKVEGQYPDNNYQMECCIMVGICQPATSGRLNISFGNVRQGKS